MKYLVLFYDSKSTAFPRTATFESPEECTAFLDKKLKAGITCFEYQMTHKYSVETTVVKTQV